MVQDAGRPRSTSAFRRHHPPLPGHYGIDTPTESELIASAHDVEEIRRFIGADSLA